MVRFVRARPLGRVPRVSVVVPCYNYGRYLPQLVKTALDQPSVDVDILIVDDASPDGSGEVAEQLAARNQRVKVLRHTSNKGHIQTYNDGLQAVTGDYVVLLSADDLLPPGALTRAVALMEAHPNVGFVYGYARSFSGEPPIVNAGVRNWSVWTGIDWLRVSARRGRSFISSPEVVMRARCPKAGRWLRPATAPLRRPRHVAENCCPLGRRPCQWAGSRRSIACTTPTCTSPHTLDG